MSEIEGEDEFMALQTRGPTVGGVVSAGKKKKGKTGRDER
jgi:hypothetical protein